MSGSRKTMTTFRAGDHVELLVEEPLPPTLGVPAGAWVTGTVIKREPDGRYRLAGDGVPTGNRHTVMAEAYQVRAPR
jgi:hypothetical protein